MIREPALAGIGEKLQEARQRRGVSLREVAESTKISVSILQALERNDISRLPGGVLARGFVRSFASAVALDPEATVAEFVVQFPLGSVTDGYPAAERAAENAVPESRLLEASIKIRRWEASPLLRLAVVGVLPAALVVYFGTTKGWPHWLAMQGRTTTARAGGVDAVVPFGVPSKNPVLSAGAGGISVQTQRSDEPVAPTSATDQARPDSVLVDSAPTRVVPAHVDSTPVAASPAPTADSAREASRTKAESPADAGMLIGDRLAVTLSVTSPSWVIATVDGKKTVNRLLQVGEQEALEARRDFVLTAGDAGAIVMTLNGALAKLLGRPGETVTARVSRTNFRDYLRR